jgi:hypothetical protein
VSTTQVELEAKFAAGVIDTSGEFAPGVADTMVHLDLQIYPRIFKKIRNDPTVTLFSGALRKVIHGKNLKQKIS